MDLRKEEGMRVILGFHIVKDDLFNVLHAIVVYTEPCHTLGKHLALCGGIHITMLTSPDGCRLKFCKPHIG